MVKTLKGKIAIVYLCLVALIGILGFISILNFYSIEKSIDGLITTNYNSIERMSSLNSILEAQNRTVLEYIYINPKEAQIRFEEYKIKFDYCRNAEKNSIIKENELLIIETIKKYYTNYCNVFDALKNTYGNDTDKSLFLYYNKILTISNDIKGEINNLIDLNETSMFERKYEATLMAEKSAYLLVTLSVFALIGGLILSIFYTNKILNPIVELTAAIKSIREGDIDHKAKVTSNDEIGILAEEFNSMTSRLLQYEKSTLCSLSEEKIKSLTIVKSISEPIIILNNKMEVILVNKSFEQLFNISETYLIGKHILSTSLNSELCNFIMSDNYDNSTFKEKILSFKIFSDELYFNVLVTAIKDKIQNINSVVVVLHNITGLKKLDKIKSDFIATISHEFKTPLTSIIMGTDLILNDDVGVLNCDQKEIAETIKDDSLHLSNLVNEMLELCKIESEKAVYNFKNCNINQIINTSMQQFEKIFELKNITVLYTENKKLPNVKADFEKITWVLNNILSNASKYTPSGGKILITVYKNNSFIYVSISDNGPGIPKEFTERIFDKFVRVEEYDVDTKGGTGIGLYVSRDIIAAHGGNIKCKSEMGIGSNFTFTLHISN